MEKEIAEMVAKNLWNQVFMEIRVESMNNNFTTIEASKPENRCLNRYRDVLPYDHSRVVVQSYPDTDYINASLVKVPKANRSYLLTQGPLATTVGHFWLTVWQQATKAVLMLNRVMEKGQSKCHQYWPEKVGDTYVLEDVDLQLEHVSSIPGNHYTVRTLRLTKISSQDSREILHYHYTTWPDFGVPQCPDTFLEFLRAVRDSGTLDQDVNGPPVVHCSAGIGRSGTFCLVDSCLVLISKQGPDIVNIREILLEMRNYRMGLIQTPDQLKFSYIAIAEGARQDGLIAVDKLSEICKREVPRSTKVSDSSSGSSDDEMGPPPLPPPRSESLKVTAVTNLDSRTNSRDAGAHPSPDAVGREDVVNGLHDDASVTTHQDGEDCACTNVPPTSSVGGQHETLSGGTAPLLSSSPNKCILNSHKLGEKKREMELRRRRKDEQRSAMKSKLQNIKDKAKECDEWSRRKQNFVDKAVPFCVGLTMLIAGSFYFYMKS